MPMEVKMSKHRSYSRFKNEPKSINFNDPVDLDDVNEVAAEEEAVEIDTDIDIGSEDLEYILESMDTVEMVTYKGQINKRSNLRKEPNMGSDVLLIMEPDTDVIVLNSAIVYDGFYQIKCNDIEGYVREDLCDVEV